MMQIPNVSLADWQRDQMPDFLWLAGLICSKDDVDDGLALAIQVLDAATAAMQASGMEASCDGTLTQLGGLDGLTRERVVQEWTDNGLISAALSAPFCAAIAQYESPASWMAEASPAVCDPGEALEWLGEIVVHVSHGQSEVATAVKIAHVRAWVYDGRVVVPQGSDIPELGTRYPVAVSDDERSQFESSMRSMFGALVSMDPTGKDRKVDWAKQFWRSNWAISPCFSHVVGSRTDEDSGDPSEVLSAAIAAGTSAVDDLQKRFDAVSSVDPDIYQPERYHVLTGITARALRMAGHYVRSSIAWTDIGLSLLRTTAESRIYMAWLRANDSNEMFERYIEYGHGKRKMLYLKWSQVLDEADEDDKDLEEFVARLQLEVEALGGTEEYQNISLWATPFGKNLTLRKLANKVGAGDIYDLRFAPASDAAHGDWSSIQKSVMQSCANPLHRGHFVARPPHAAVLQDNIFAVVLDDLDEIVEIYEELMKNS